MKRNNVVGHDLLTAQMCESTILTEEDWDEFKKMFNQVFPRFIPSLKKSHPDLTPAEVRCLCLEKLQLSNNKMALATGVSPNTVIKTKSRLRKKLNLQTQEELEKFVRELTEAA